MPGIRAAVAVWASHAGCFRHSDAAVDILDVVVYCLCLSARWLAVTECTGLGRKLR
jgi:hypothetical protein